MSADSGEPDDPAPAVRAAVEAFYAAFNTHAFEQAGQFTTDDWEHINPFGGWTRGRELVLAELRAVHANFLHGVSDTPKTITLRRVTAEVYLVGVVSQMSPYATPDGARHEHERHMRTFVVVRQGGRWLIALDQNTTIRD